MIRRERPLHPRPPFPAAASAAALADASIVAFTLALALAATACERRADPGGAEGDFQVRDSAGIEVVENYAPEHPPGRFWTIAPEPEIVLGGHGTAGEPTHDSAHMVWDVRGLARLADGRVAILSAQGFKLLLFEPSGRFSKYFGHEGEGPGDFIHPEYLQYLPGDTLVVWNYRFGPVIHFDTTGFVLRHHTPDLVKITDLRREIPGRTKRWIGPWLHMETRKAPLRDGSFVAFVNLDQNPADIPRFRPEHEYVRVDSTYTAYSLGLWDGDETLNLGDGESMGGLLGTSFASGGDPLSIYIADGAKNEIHQFSPDGSLVRIMRRVSDPVPFRVESWRKQGENVVEQLAGHPQGGDSIARAWGRRYERAGALLEGTPYPAVEALQVDTEGNLWVREWSTTDSDHPDQWSVFSPRGRWLGTLRAPGSERGNPIFCTTGGGFLHAPCWIGKEFFLGVTRDDMDVESVVGYRIDRKE